MKYIFGKKSIRIYLQVICVFFVLLSTAFRPSAEEIEPEIRLEAQYQYNTAQEPISVHVSASAGSSDQEFVLETEYDHAAADLPEKSEEGFVIETKSGDKLVLIPSEGEDGKVIYRFSLPANTEAEFDLVFKYQEKDPEADKPEEEKEEEKDPEETEVPEEIKEEETEPEETAVPEETAEPEETADPVETEEPETEEGTEPEEEVTEPEETEVPEEITEEETEPEETAVPEETEEPEETAEPEETEEPAEPEQTAEPEETAEPSETEEPVEQQEVTEPEETTEPAEEPVETEVTEETEPEAEAQPTEAPETQEEITEEPEETPETEEESGFLSSGRAYFLRLAAPVLLEEAPEAEEPEGSVKILYGTEKGEKEEFNLIWVTADALREQTWTSEIDDTIYEISGILPIGGKAEILPCEKITIKGQTIMAAAEVKVLFPSGAEYQPAEKQKLTVVMENKALRDHWNDMVYNYKDPMANLYAAETVEGPFESLGELRLERIGRAVIETESLGVFAVTLAQKRPGPLKAAPPGATDADLDFIDEDIIHINMFDYTAYDADYAEQGSFNNSNIRQNRFRTGINVDSNGNWRNLLFFPSGVHKGYGQPYTINNYTGGNRRDNDQSGNGQPIYYPAALQGIVKNQLVNGYPELAYGWNGSNNVQLGNGAAGSSLEYLFNPNDHSANFNGQTNRRDYIGLEHLFYKVDGRENKVEFDSSKYYAYLPSGSTDFNVYELYSGNKPLGFFPFDEYTPGKTSANLSNNFNHQFGMTMEAEFMIPPNGKLINPDGSVSNEDETFVFTGDDDIWVFIDGKLVLDLGGIHKPLKGTINFATGEVTLDHFQNFMTSDGSENIYPYAVHVGDTINQTASTVGTPEHVQQTNLATILGADYKDKPYEKHTIQVFYLERGGCDSNLKMQMNMEFPKKLTLEKEVVGQLKDEYTDEEFSFKFYLEKISGGYAAPGGPQLVTNTQTHLTDPVNSLNNRTIRLIKTDREGNKSEITPDPETGIFKLKHGEKAEVRYVPGSLHYYFEEVVDTGVFPTTTAETIKSDGEIAAVPLTPSGEASSRVYRTDTSTTDLRNNVKYLNGTGFRLPVEKEWQDEEGVATTMTAEDYYREFGNQKLVFKLLRKIETDEDFTDTGLTVELPNDEGDTWKGAFSNLPSEDENGHPYIYSIEEISVPGYESTINDLDNGTAGQTGRRSLGEQFVKVTGQTLVPGETYVFVRHDNDLPVRVANYSQETVTYGSAVTKVTPSGMQQFTDATGKVIIPEYLENVPVESQFNWNGSAFRRVGDNNGYGLDFYTSGWWSWNFAYRTRNANHGQNSQTDIWEFTANGEGRIRYNNYYVSSSTNIGVTNSASSAARFDIYHREEVFTEATGYLGFMITNRKIPLIDLNFLKTATMHEEGEDPAVLQGAHFSLEEQDGTEIDTAISAADGTFGFTQLPVRDEPYYLRETQAPAGYMLADGRWEIQTVSISQYKIRKEGDTEWETVSTASGADPYQIKNLELYELPNSGGTGTYWNTIVGTAVFMIALLRILRERKRGRHAAP